MCGDWDEEPSYWRRNNCTFSEGSVKISHRRARLDWWKRKQSQFRLLRVLQTHPSPLIARNRLSVVAIFLVTSHALNCFSFPNPFLDIFTYLETRQQRDRQINKYNNKQTRASWKSLKNFRFFFRNISLYNIFCMYTVFFRIHFCKV